jgi:hypothetical protein
VKSGDGKELLLVTPEERDYTRNFDWMRAMGLGYGPFLNDH